MCYCYITALGQGQKDHINLANKQVSHNTKIKSRERNHQLAYQEHSCTAPSGVMGRRRRDRHYSPPKNNSIQDSVRNEENRYPFLDLNKIMNKCH
jgi:hypothetical protein